MILVKLKDISVMEKISECKYTKIAKICRSYLVIFFVKQTERLYKAQLLWKRKCIAINAGLVWSMQITSIRIRTFYGRVQPCFRTSTGLMIGISKEKSEIPISVRGMLICRKYGGQEISRSEHNTEWFFVFSHNFHPVLVVVARTLLLMWNVLNYVCYSYIEWTFLL